MRLIPPLPAWRRRPRRPPGGRAAGPGRCPGPGRRAPAGGGDGQPGDHQHHGVDRRDPGRPGHLVPDPRRAPLPDGRRRPGRGRESQDRAAVGGDRVRPGDPRPGHRDHPEVPGRRMRLTRRPARPGPPRRSRGRRAAVLALAIACAALIVAAGRLAAGAGGRAGPPGGHRHGDHRRAPGSRRIPVPVPVAVAAARARRRHRRLRVPRLHLLRDQRDHRLVRGAWSSPRSTRCSR